MCMAFSPTGAAVAGSFEGNNSIVVYSLDGFHRRDLIGHSEMAACLAYSSDGRFLASAARDGTIRVWDVVPASQAAIIPVKGHIPRDLAFLRQTSYIALGSEYRRNDNKAIDGLISIFRVSDGKSVDRLEGHADSVNCLDISKDGKILASGGDDGRVIVWEIDPDSWS